MSAKLTESQRELLVNSSLTALELAAHFGCSLVIIKRLRKEIRAGEPAVYLIPPPPPPRTQTRRHFINTDDAAPSELREDPLGVDSVAACDNHLVDLKRCHTPLSSPVRPVICEPRRRVR
jgi:hypothetical protein